MGMEIKDFARQMWLGFLDLWYPPHCESCGTAIAEAALVLCSRCRSDLPLIALPRCHRCSFPFDGEMAGFPEFECHDCRERRFAFDCCVAPFRFRNPIRKMILELKYQRQSRLGDPLGEWLGECVATDARLASVTLDGIVPAPLHPVRLRERGFNQAELLAEKVAARTGVPLLNLLRRTRYTSTQTARDRRERMENLKGAFELKEEGSLKGRTLLIVDDVFTTGSTIEACAQVLNGAGARVFAATAARG